MAKLGSFSSLFNLQSKSINFNFGHLSLIFGQNTKAIALLFWPKLAHFHHFSICNQNSINFNFGHFSLMFGQNTKAIALLFGQNWLIFITFQSAIKINQFQFRSFFAHVWAKYQGYSLTFWPKLAHFHHFFNLQSKSINFNFGHFSLIFRQNTKAIALLFGQTWLIFHHFSICNQKSINFNFGHLSLIFGQNTKAYSLTFWPKLAHFHHFSICNQTQSISISVIFRSFVGKIPRL